MEAVTRSVPEMKKTKLFLAAILITNIMTMLNTTTVTISLPSYMTIFHVDINTVQWVSVGYLLPLGMVMPLSEYLSERYSYRTVFLGGVLAVGVCSLGCACSVNFPMLIAFRFLKGVAGGLVIPCTMAMLYRYVPKYLQASYLGNTVLFQSVGVAVGPTLAGFLLQISSWHVLFLFNLPLVCLAFLFGKQSIPRETGDQRDPIDFFGMLQVTVGTGFVMIAFTEADTWGWHSILFLSCFAIGLLLVITFILRQLHTARPLLNFAVLKYKPFTLALLIQCTLAMTLGITAILVQIYCQTVRGYTPAETGMFLLVPSIMMLVGNSVANMLHKRVKARWLITGGLLLAFLGNLGLCRVQLDSAIVLLVASFSLRYLGMGMMQMPLTNYGLSSVPQELSGHASSMFNWGKQLTQVVSMNILTVLLSFHLRRYYLAAGNTGVPQTGTMAYNLAATQAVGTDFFYLSVALFLSLCCSFWIRSSKDTEDLS